MKDMAQPAAGRVRHREEGFRAGLSVSDVIAAPAAAQGWLRRLLHRRRSALGLRGEGGESVLTSPESGPISAAPLGKALGKIRSLKFVNRSEGMRRRRRRVAP